MPIANENDRGRAREICCWPRDGVDALNLIFTRCAQENCQRCSRIAQSYAEVREEAGAWIAEAKRLLQTQQDLIDSYRMSEENAHRAGMEEAARIVREKCGACSGSGVGGEDALGNAEECEYCGRPMSAIRAAMKEGK